MSDSEPQNQPAPAFWHFALPILIPAAALFYWMAITGPHLPSDGGAFGDAADAIRRAQSLLISLQLRQLASEILPIPLLACFVVLSVRTSILDGQNRPGRNILTLLIYAAAIIPLYSLLHLAVDIVGGAASFAISRFHVVATRPFGAIGAFAILILRYFISAFLMLVFIKIIDTILNTSTGFAYRILFLAGLPISSAHHFDSKYAIRRLLLLLPAIRPVWFLCLSRMASPQKGYARSTGRTLAPRRSRTARRQRLGALCGGDRSALGRTRPRRAHVAVSCLDQFHDKRRRRCRRDPHRDTQRRHYRFHGAVCRRTDAHWR